MKIKLKKFIDDKYITLSPESIYEAEKMEDVRYMVHLSDALSIIVRNKNVQVIKE